VIHQLHPLDLAYHLLVLVHKPPTKGKLPRDQEGQWRIAQLNQSMYLILWQLHIHKTTKFLTVSM
jgi:hypothetical protein